MCNGAATKSVMRKTDSSFGIKFFTFDASIGNITYLQNGDIKSIFYKSYLENSSAFKISSNGPHISVYPVRKYARPIWGNFKGGWIF